MSGLLSTSLTGLRAAQRSLEAVQHNISNVNTEGYSRQRVELGARPAQFTGDGYIGQGVNINNVTRSYDQFINKQLSSSLSAFGEVDRYHQLATRVDNIMADAGTGIAPVMKRFFNAVNELANDPSSIPSRQVLLAETDALTQSFNTMSGRFEDIRALNNNDIAVMVDEINSLATSIADLNVQIVNDLGKTQGFRQPNDLLDKRDALISSLSEIVNVSVVQQNDGMTSVFIGNGQALVLNGGAAAFTTLQSEFDPGRLEIGIKTVNGIMEMTDQISGGSLGGSLRFRDEVLDPAQQKLGRVAVGLAMDFNAVHKSGFDLSGAAGLDLFNFSGVEVPVIQSSSNSGSAAVTVNFQDTNPLASGSLDFSDFNLKYVNSGGGVDYTLTRIRDNKVINLTATDTVPPTGVYSLSFAATQPSNFDPTDFTLSTSISPGAFTQAVSSGTAAVAQEEQIGAFTTAVSNGADTFTMNIDGIPFYTEPGSVGGTVTGAELDTALNAFLAQPANAGAYTKVSGSFSGGDLVLRKFSGTAISVNITSNFATTPGAFAANTVNVAGSVAVAATGGPFTLEVDGLQIYTEAASIGGTVTKNELDAALNTFLTTGRGAGVYVKTGSFATNDLVLSKAGSASTLTISSNFSGVGSTAGAFSGSTTGVTAVPAGIDITVDLSGGKTISVGDQFVTRPTYSAAQKIGVNIDDPKKIAAATNVEVDPVTKLPVFPASIIKGAMPNDNRNAILLAGLENRLGMLGGSASFSDAYGQIVSGVGTLTRTAEVGASAQETLLNQAKDSRESLVGVNLDEEAANLIKFQQAYQASAQSISMAKSLFDTLIGAVR
ncbi:flagellar hook-associated protein 1 FlgK [Methylobacter tundripaludum]|uniref:Flagellar hook-associated protein 1 n=1 Tax=Methylobacter tundripaludum TaxID=173365 RepID=A0A2S6H2W9_9GAMM|nr:flagellar hook-associated protein FlgK [Methylobacter tundripaludum]PPK71828.1 flagellar hook-associated protein 1 FlgK [Methylobacter tundripaludum]